MITLRTRILAVFVLLLLVIVALILTMIERTTYTHTLEQLEERLSTGYQVFENEMKARREYQDFVTSVVAGDFGLQGEIASVLLDGAPVETLEAALETFRRRSNSTFMLAASPSGALLAATSDTPEFQALPLDKLVDVGVPKVRDVLLVWSGQVDHLFVTPVFAPRPQLLAWLINGYAFSDSDAARLASLTDLGVSVLQVVDGRYEVLASSLPGDLRGAWTHQALLAGSGIGTREINGRSQVLFSAAIDHPGGLPLVLMLQSSLSDAMQSYEDLQWRLLVLVLVAMLVAVVAAYLVAGTVTRPLARMMEYVRRVGAGDYAAAAPEVSGGEVGILVQEFVTMQGDIAEREQAIRHLAYHDTLTDLPNRNQFRVAIQEQIARSDDGQHFVVLIMDLDNFKDINDTLGHLAGDRLLKDVSRRLDSARRERDQLARLGGDEFAIMMTSLERHDVIPLTIHYRDALAAPFQVEGITLHLNCTIGIAIYPEHGENPVTLLQRADVAMYVGKENHLPYCLYNIRDDRHSLLRLTLMSELKGAIERNELTLHYQPKLDLNSNCIAAVECLVRWIHPQHGFIPPDEFIPLAEQTGNVRYLTDWVLDTALAQLHRWQEQGLSMRIAINVSAVDLQIADFTDKLADMLRRHGQAAQHLVLEITESAIMRDPEHAVAQLARLDAMGVRISIDDFGTGYSSMAQLKHLPVHELKIDKSFVLDVVDNDDDAIIVRATIDLGHNMGLQVVAEGVESSAALELLRSYRCDWVQGYYLSKPLPADEFDRWLSSSPYRARPAGIGESA